MRNKVILVFIVVLGLVFFGMTGKSFADAAAELEQAKNYYQNREYQKAEQSYQNILNQYPDTDYAFEAQKGLTIVYIAWDKQPQAEAAYQQLLTDFSTNAQITQAVFEIADTYYWFGKYEKANQLYQYVVATWPDAEHAMWAQMGLAISNIADGNDTAAEAATENLIANFNDDPNLPEALFYIAGRYGWDKKYEQAESLYSTIAQQFPESPQAGEVPFAIARINVLSLIESGITDVALEAIDSLIADFNDRSDLPWVLSHRIAEQLYNKAFQLEAEDLTNQARDYFQKAVEIWEMVTKESPSYTCTADGYTWAGHCYRKLGRYEKAINCYQKVADNYPEHRLAWNALFLVGRCYENLKKSGLISKSEADPKIKAAYQQLVEKYPDCKAAKLAQDWLNKNIEKTEIHSY